MYHGQPLLTPSIEKVQLLCQSRRLWWLFAIEHGSGSSAVGAVSGGCEQDAQPVVVEISESVCEPADFLDDQVDGFGAAVGHAASVEVGENLGLPGLEGTAEPGDLGDRAGGEAGDHLLRDSPALGCGGVVDGAELLVTLPGQVHFLVGVASLQAAGELSLLTLGEALDAVAEQPADLVERVILVAAVAERVLLDAAADLVDDLRPE